MDLTRIEQILSVLTNSFTESTSSTNKGIVIDDIDKRDAAVNILKKYYEDVDFDEGKSVDGGIHKYILKYSNPLKESLILCEDDEPEEDAEEAPKEDSAEDNSDSSEDDINLETEEPEDEFDLDPDDDLDLSEMPLDTIDDSSEIDNADDITILKKRASDLADKWKDTFKQICDNARVLGLIATHDDELNIELKKSDGSLSDYEYDLDYLEQNPIDTTNVNDVDNYDTFDDLSDNENNSDGIDDDFGPSKYDTRAESLSIQHIEMINEESTANNSSIDIKPQMVENIKIENSPIDEGAEALSINMNEIDDDM